MTNFLPPNWGDDPLRFIHYLAADYNGLPASRWAYSPEPMLTREPTHIDVVNVKMNALTLVLFADEAAKGPYALEWILFAEHVRVAVDEWLTAFFPEWDD